MRLTGLYVYPLKSARGLAVARAAVEPRGLQHDRRFMLVDAESGVFQSQRTLPRMTLINLELGENFLRAHAPDRAPIEWPLAPPSGPGRRVEVWGDPCDAISVSPDADRWFRDFLDAPVSLVYMPDESLRPVDPDYAPPDAQVSFADGFPFLLASVASLDALNARLDAPVTIERFRPNFVVDGCPAFDEDEWRDFTIGGLAFRGVKPCARCPIPNVDPDTAHVDGAVLRALATFRKFEHKVLFGQNLLGPGAGTVAVGAAVEVISRR